MFCDNQINKQAGMTLIEILVVLGLLTLVGGFSIVMGVDSYRNQLFRSDRDILISALHRARALAMSNVCFGESCTDGLHHGVRIEPGRFIIFQGRDFNASDEHNEVIEMAGGAVVSGITEVVFHPLSGEPSTTGDIIITDSGSISTTTIGAEGQIFWTH